MTAITFAPMACSNMDDGKTNPSTAMYSYPFSRFNLVSWSTSPWNAVINLQHLILLLLQSLLFQVTEKYYGQHLAREHIFHSRLDTLCLQHCRYHINWNDRLHSIHMSHLHGHAVQPLDSPLIYIWLPDFLPLRLHRQIHDLIYEVTLH